MAAMPELALPSTDSETRTAVASFQRWFAHHASALLTIGLVTCVAYWPALGFDFVNWDDPWYVLENPLIQSWSVQNLLEIATRPAVRNYAPLTLASYLVDHSIWGLNPLGYHLVNVLWHVLNAVLVYQLLLQLTGSRLTGLLTAVLFAIHPVNIESVAWISSRKGVMSAAGILAGSICWLRPERTARQEVWAIVFLILALLTKAIAVVVPAIWLLYDVLVRRQRLADALPRQFIPGLLCVWLLLATMAAQTALTGGVRDHLSLSKLEILGLDSVILWRYVGMLLWPRELNVLYDPPTSGIGLQILASCLAWCGVAVALVRVRDRHPQCVLAALSFLLFLLPVLNLFPLTTLMNDRYLYLPSIAFFGALVGASHWGIQAVRERVAPRTALTLGLLLTVLAVGAAGVYSQRTAEQLPVWRNGTALWRHAMRCTPHLAVVHIQWANTLHKHGRTQQALAVLQRALTNCDPDEIDRRRIEEKLETWRAELAH